MATTDTQLTWRRGFAVQNGIEYPTSVGRYLMATPRHEQAVRFAMGVLDRYLRFRHGADVFIHRVYAICYDPDDLTRFVIPDLMVARGQWGRHEEAYRTWEAPMPHFVLEVASVATRDRELGFLKEEYERLGVEEYWQLDQSGELLDEPLMGHRLTDQGYRVIESSGQRAGKPEYWSEALGLYLRERRDQHDLMVQFRDPITGEDLPTDDDMAKALDEMPKQIEELDQLAKEKEAALRETQQKVAENSKRLRELRASNRAVQQKVAENSKRLQELRASNRAAQQRAAETRKRLRDLRAAKRTAQQRAAETRRQLRAARAASQASDLRIAELEEALRRVQAGSGH